MLFILVFYMYITSWQDNKLKFSVAYSSDVVQLNIGVIYSWVSYKLIWLATYHHFTFPIYKNYQLPTTVFIINLPFVHHSVTFIVLKMYTGTCFFFMNSFIQVFFQIRTDYQYTGKIVSQLWTFFLRKTHWRYTLCTARPLVL